MPSLDAAVDRAPLTLERPLLVVVDVSNRGRSVAELALDAIDLALAQVAAPAAGRDAVRSVDHALGDAVFRAKQAQRSGVEIVLEGLAARGGPVLDGNDSASLKSLLEATHCRPLRVTFGPGAEGLMAHDAPQPLLALANAWSARAPAQSAPPPPLPTPAPKAATRAPIAASLSATYRKWTQELEAARGPQSLAALERIFTQSYVPLASAIARGQGDERAKEACAQFRAGFERAYSDAFQTFGITGKRPRMVLDAPDVAAPLIRLHRARKSQLAIVESLRYDLGRPLRERVLASLGPHAELVFDGLLYASLPTTRAVQLDALARGKASLRSGDDPPPSEMDLPPLRSPSRPRALRLGGRGYALLSDLVSGAPERALVDVADGLVQLARELGPRGLLFVFGDRGAAYDPKGKPGGASPEEVIVPAFAVFVDAPPA